jgi:hypothetical protein
MGAPARFSPGTMLGGRYQIASAIGKGGMGEVYRADDLVLGQTVALKFLPETLVNDPDWLDRLRSEVRAARQVSHPNVCRVYDIVEAEGHTFVSMEFVAGEDLASLLRRIGRLAPDRAAEMARGLCAGLAAAHDKGILHRDLKPANVLIDEQGRVRLADFGLAGGDPATEQGLVGTPAYMAPELFERKPATVQSDIYALGLVLYEMFTGRPAFTGATVRDFARQHRETTPTRLTTLVAEVDPLADRIIQRCLAKDPDERPASALAVAAALPGGDPLAAALAAGETPSPAMVAASGGVGAVAPGRAMALLAVLGAGLLAVVWLSERTQAVHYLPVTKSPAVLFDAAATLATTFGFTDPVRDSVSGFTNTDYVQYLLTSDQSPGRWENLRPGQPPGVVFWYRQSSVDLFTDSLLLGGRVTLNRPPPTTPGSVSMLLDLKGRLQFLTATLPRIRDTEEADRPPDWAVLLKAAGFDGSKLTPVDPSWVPPVYADHRIAWDGVYPDRPDIAVHIEAAEAHGVPVYFQIFEPWSPKTLQPPTARSGITLSSLVGLTLVALLLVGGVLLARRNLRLGRGDQSGAARVAVALGTLHFAAGLVTAHHTFQLTATMVLLLVLTARAALIAGAAYMVYVGLEPDVRRRSPETLVSWSRAISGRWQDPLVGRDILFGLVLAVILQLVAQTGHLAPGWIGHAPTLSTPPTAFDGTVLQAVATVFVEVVQAVLIATSLVLAYVLLSMVTRRRSVTTVVFLLLLLAAAAANNGWTLAAVTDAVTAALVVVALAHVGLLTVIVGLAAQALLDQIPLTFDPTSIWAAACFSLLGLVVAVAIFGFRTSLAGRPMFELSD